MPLAGNDRTAVEAFWRQAPPLNQTLRQELEAGCIANDVYVAILEAPQDPSAADFDRDVKDCCTAAAVPMLAKQNMVVKWRREVLSTGPVANVPDHIAQRGRAPATAFMKQEAANPMSTLNKEILNYYY